MVVFGSIPASTEEGRKELRFLSNCNPEQLERLCASL
jgi:small subunit ribosomal protein S29